MATHRQIPVNTRNAQYRSGLKNDEGKRKSRMNALKHGMSANTVVLPYEDEVEYHELRAQLVESYAPANNQELMLVDQIAASYWRTMRSRAYEREMLSNQVKTRKIDNGLPPAINCAKDDLATAVVLTKEPQKSFGNYFRYDASIERSYYRAIAALERLQSRRTRQERQDSGRTKEAPLTMASPSSPIY
jgi:hypothetical protein